MAILTMTWRSYSHRVQPATRGRTCITWPQFLRQDWVARASQSTPLVLLVEVSSLPQGWAWAPWALTDFRYLGSTINGMMLNRGAADDYDNWERLNNSGWGWNGLLPYFVRSTMFQAPSPTLQEEFNITWNESAYGLDGPIHVSYAPFQWPGVSTCLLPCIFILVLLTDCNIRNSTSRACRDGMHTTIRWSW